MGDTLTAFICLIAMLLPVGVVHLAMILDACRRSEEASRRVAKMREKATR